MSNPTMNAIVNTGPGRLEWIERTLPEPTAGQVRVRTLAVGICHTDLNMIAGWDRTGFPSIPGHEWVGVVDAVGPGGAKPLVGRRCVADNVLADGGEVGFEHSGGYGQYFLTEEANIRMLPDGLAVAPCALIEPLAVCVRGWNRLDRHAEGRMMIIGDGPIGLLMLLLARHFGVADVTLVGGRNPRLTLAGELGASRCINYHALGTDAIAGLRRECGHEFPTIVEASGSAMAMQMSLALTERCGRILLMGDYGDQPAKFPWLHLILRELSLIGSNASAGAWDEAVQLATEAHLPLERLVTHRMPAQQFAHGIELTGKKGDGVIKVVLEW